MLSQQAGGRYDDTKLVKLAQIGIFRTYWGRPHSVDSTHNVTSEAVDSGGR